MQRFPATMLQEIEQRGLMTNERPFFESLRVPADDGLTLVGIDPAVLDATAQRFAFSTQTGSAVTIDLHYFRTDHIPHPNVVIYGRFITENGTLIAIWASTIFLDH